MTDRHFDVLVLGAGVVGLTSAICLAEAGMRVAVQAARQPAATTSVAAGALWGMHLVGADDRVPRWAGETREVLATLDLAAGVHACDGLMATVTAMDAPPEATGGTGYVPCDPGELPPGYATGWRVAAAPLIAMPAYLRYLAGRLHAAGGVMLSQRTFASLAEVAAAHPAASVIVSCPGAGARALVPDSSVTAVRGQAVVAANPGITEFFVGTGADPDEISYVFPHGDTVVLGGTQEHGNWNLAADPATADRILSAAAAVDPRLAGVTVLEHRVGLRPVRPHVRLEAEAVSGDRYVIHNYGHGGAGVSLSWGCGREAARLALAVR
ncbi:MAG: FAD-dependent oxidoreductase [Streptosporangiaceae bacterium]